MSPECLSPAVPAVSASTTFAWLSAAPSQPSSPKASLTLPSTRPNLTPVSHPGCFIRGKITQQTQFWGVTNPEPSIQATALLYTLTVLYTFVLFTVLISCGSATGFLLVNGFIPKLSTQSPVISELHLDVLYRPLCNARGVLHKPPSLF